MFWCRLDERFGGVGRSAGARDPGRVPGRSAQRQASTDESAHAPGRRAHRRAQGAGASDRRTDQAGNAIVAWMVERGTPAPVMLRWLRGIERQTSRSLGGLVGRRGPEHRLALALLAEFASAHHLSIHEAAVLLDDAEPLALAAVRWLRRAASPGAGDHPNE